MEKTEFLKLLREMTDDARYKHTLGVVDCARELAGIFGVNQHQAEVAALLHDCARCLGPQNLLATAEGQGLPVDELERKVPELLHGKVGAFFARTRFGIDDRAVLRAVELHTLGAREMTRLDKIVFIADMIEPGRDFPGVGELRETARRELDRALLKCFDATIRYVVEKQQYIHPRSIDARNAVLLILRQQAGT